jgi:hypothetical protein
VAESRLEQILSAVQQRVAELVPGVTFAFGDQFVAINAAPPRVVWLRDDTGTTIQPAQTTAFSSTPSRAMRVAAVVAVCWAAKGGDCSTDDAACEALLDAVVLALRECLGTAAALPFAESWVPESWAKQGRAARLLFAVRMPIVAPALPEVATDANPIDVGFDTDTSADPDGALDAVEADV